MFDQLKTLSKSLNPTSEILLDVNNMPSEMIYIPKFNVDTVITGGPATVHPMFDVWKGGAWVTLDGIYVSKYLNVVHNSLGYSLPYEEPAHTLDIDTALAYCENKGTGWHLMSFMEWAGIALWCKKNLTIPRGNNNNGYDITYTSEYGTKTSGNYTATGSGHHTWTHDFLAGITDLNGNVAEWLSGMRTLDGEVHLMERGKPADAGVAGHAVASALWKSLNKTTGAFQAIGANAIFMDARLPAPTGIRYADSVTNTTTDLNSISEKYQDLTSVGSANAAALLLLKTYGLYPDGSYADDLCKARNNGERFACRGGDYADGISAGIFALNLLNTRTATDAKIGFRSVWCDLT